MNDFQIISKLGEGAYSIVYKVRRLIDENIYALKKVKLINLSEKERKNSLNEIRLLASIKSKFVISYKEAFFDEKDNTLGMVMEYADGGDLYRKIKESYVRKRLFEESEIWRIFIQLVKGLKALHDLNILHRDLKSSNVFLNNDGSVKLGDLNVSKVEKKGMGYTQTGTPYYASPEVWNDKPYGTKSDIWSLGCILYEMITLRPPFRAKSMEELYKKVTQGIFNKIPSQFSNDLYKIVQLLLQVNPEKRPSCSEILKNPIIQRRIEFFKNYSGDDCSEDQALLKTILVPNNLCVLSDKLPKPNYGHKSVNNKKSNNNLNEKAPNYNNESEVTAEEVKKNEIITNLNVLKKNASNKNSISILNRPIISNKSNKSVDKLENAKNLLLKNIITKSVSKRELPGLKKNIFYEEKRNMNPIPNSYNSENIIRKKNDNIFDILNKKNLIRVNHLNRLQRQNINKLIIHSSKNNAIINMNSEISNNHGSNSIDLYRKKGNAKIPGRLIPIKKNLLNIA